MSALLEVDGLKKHFPVTSGVFGRVTGLVRAVDGVSFAVARGETLALVGESGSGKTTAGRAILRLIEPTAGRVTFEGRDVRAAGPKELRELRRHLQIVFQDPYGSLNPRMRVIDLLGEALEVHGLAQGAAVELRVRELLSRVGLSPSWLERYPHEFSGGQRQRLGIARAIALEPKLVVCDEAVSALDVSVQAQVLNLLRGLGRELSLSYLFIAHDLSVVRHVSNRVAVMYLGQIVELAPVARLFAAPAHPYTRALLSAIPLPDPTRQRRRLVLAGDVPSPLDPPPGCRFHTRCPAAIERCRTEEPAEHPVESGHFVKCVHAEGAEGPDWQRLVDERIELATRARAPSTHKESITTGPTFEPEGPPAKSEVAELPWSRRLEPAQRRLLTLAVVLFLVLGVLGLRAWSRVRAAEQDLAALSAEIVAFRFTSGRLPERLSELGWRLPPLLRDGALVDPWGRPFLYQPITPEPSQDRSSVRHEQGFGLKSLGPDGVPSDDDIAHPR